MSGWYLSSPTCITSTLQPSDIEALGYARGHEWMMQHYLPMMWQEYGQVVPERKGSTLDCSIPKLSVGADSSLSSIAQPTNLNVTAFALAAAAINELLRRNDNVRMNFQHLVYCPETADPDYQLTPALYFKKTLRLKGLLPFALSHCGSSTLSGTLELLDWLADPGGDPRAGPVLFVTAAKETRSFPVTESSRFPLSNAAAACILSPVSGEWRIIRSRHYSRPLSSPDPYSWTEAEHRQQQELLLEQCKSELTAFLLECSNEHTSCDHALSYAIIQHLNTDFLDSISQLLPCPIYTRQRESTHNLHGSDGLVSLQELSKNNPFTSGTRILILQAGPISHLGFILLERTEELMMK